jgi:3-dehydroquinate synthase
MSNQSAEQSGQRAATLPASEALDVSLGERSYPIHIGHGLLADPALVRRHVGGGQVAVVSNERVAGLYLDALRAAFDGSHQLDVFLMADGEQYKSLETYGALMAFLLERRHNRTTTLIALGGGVVGDLTGFAAATFQRGVDFLQIPTTLLAQVDSSVGGKTAVNHPLGKNMIGAFHQPRAVLADLAVLGTLAEREYRAGLAEVLKYGVIRDAQFFAWLEASHVALLARDPAALQHAVRRSCEIKAEVVAADEREGGLRAILNFGHTFGHALETLTGYQQLLHGEAVAIGMVMAADLSARLGDLAGADARRIRDLLTAFGLPVTPPPLAPADMLRVMGMDKKVMDGRLRLVLARGLGRAEGTAEVDPAAIEATLTADGWCHD